MTYEEKGEEQLFCDYFEEWTKEYKEGTIRYVTLLKYKQALKNLREIVPNLKLKDMDRKAYQGIINKYALTHEKQTVTDFHHTIKASILDAVDEGFIRRNPTRKVVIKGKPKTKKTKKYLDFEEAEKLVEAFHLDEKEINYDWMFLLAIKTGMRFEELLGLTVDDFDFSKLTITIDKAFDYKYTQDFCPTKNRSSMRKIKMDWKTAMQFSELLKDKDAYERVFDFGRKIYSTTVNDALKRRCREAGVTEITMHCLRHTHASILMYKDVSIHSISKRLGHSSTEITQKVYLHLIKELEIKDDKKVMAALMELDY